jgi:hypothetical protein
MIAEAVPASETDAVAEAKAQLLQVFGTGSGGSGGGVTARGADFSRVLPEFDFEAVHDALEELGAEGIVEVTTLPGGTAVYSFPRH